MAVYTYSESGHYSGKIVDNYQPNEKSMRFDSPDWAPHSQENHIRVWTNDESETVSLTYMPEAPNIPIPLNPDNLPIIRDHFRQLAVDLDGGLVSTEIKPLFGIHAIETIFKFPLEPSGMRYTGSVIFPFKDCSFILEFQCQDTGPTGLRDTMAYSREIMDLEVDGQGKPIGWLKDPYDAEYNDAALYNLSDDAKYDKSFPDHPLSRVRDYLSRLPDMLDVDPQLKQYPPHLTVH